MNTKGSEKSLPFFVGKLEFVEKNFLLPLRFDKICIRKILKYGYHAREGVEYVLRVICGCTLFGEFFYGLHIIVICLACSTL